MRRLPVLLLACALALLPGCGGGGGDKSSSKSSSTAAPSAPAPVKAGQPAKAIAGMDGTVDGKPARLDILSLTRSGATSQLTLRLSNTNPDATQSGIQIADTFDDGVNGTAEHPNDPFTVDGLSLVDTVNRKKYLVARDTEGKCVCDGGLSNVFVKAKQSVNLSATFGAPPGTVRTVNVFVPKFGTFRNVPIS
jgi:hypothetical protein